MHITVKVFDNTFEAQQVDKSKSSILMNQDRCYIPVVFNYKFPIIDDFADQRLADEEFEIEMTVGIPHYGISVLWLNDEASTLITRYNTVVESMKLPNNHIDYDEYTLCREFLSYLDKCGATIDLKE